MITTSRLRARLRYEPEPGALIWLVRPIADCASEREAKRWNTCWAGKRAGTVKARGWRDIVIDDHTYRAARIIWQIVTGEWPPFEIDHWNGDRSDDRWSNLRHATKSQNMGNQKRHADGTSGFKGVVWVKKDCCWKAQIGHKYTTRYLGSFDSPEEAHAAYMAAALEAYGEFARPE
jgi:hypothetical protein